MTENQAPPASPAPQTTAPQGGSGNNLLFTLLGALPGFIAGLAGAGWPGVVALLAGGLALVFGSSAILNRINRGIDGRDSALAGADAGKTAVDLAQQGQANRQDLAELEAQSPPDRAQ